MTWFLQLACLFLLCLPSNGLSLEASDPKIAWSGRTAASTSGSVAFDWLGVSARLTVTNASYVTANITTSAAMRGTRLKVYTSDQGYELYPLVQFWLTPLVDTHVLFADTAKRTGQRTLTLENLVDPQYSTGITTVHSFETDGVFVATAPSKRVLEFIGDSITAATNVVRPAGAPSCGDGGFQSDFSQTYEALLCHQFRASCSTIAVGGKCMLRECGGLQMPDYYLSAFYQDAPHPTFEFASAPVPDGIFIDLGTNDDRLFPSQADTFVNTTLAFLHNATLRYKSREIQFFLSIGPMENATASATRRAVEEANAAGFKATLVDMQAACWQDADHPPGQGDFCDGCANHPGIEAHKNMAAAAAPVLARVLGWS